MSRFDINNYRKYCLLAALLIAMPTAYAPARAQQGQIPDPPDREQPAEAQQSAAPAEAEAADDQDATESEAQAADEAGEQQQAEDDAPADGNQQEAAPDADGGAQDAEPEGEEGRRTVERLGDSVGTGNEWTVDIPERIDGPEQPAEPAVDVTLPDQQLDGELQDVLVDLARDSDNEAAQNQLEAILDEVGTRAADSIAAGEFETASRYMNVLRTLQPERPQLGELEQQLEQARELDSLVAQGEAALADGRLIAPPDDNALAAFRQALEQDSDNQAASDGLAEVRQALVDRALSLGGEFDFETAQSLLDEAEGLPGDAGVSDARQRLGELREQRAAELQDTIVNRIDGGDYEGAASALDELVALGGYGEEVRRLRVSLEDARLYGGFEPGQVFQDDYAGGSASGPEMVVVPAGSFMMGAPPEQEPRSSYEQPYHQVTFERGFAMARTEITVGQFRDFVEATGYRTEAETRDGSTVYVERTGRLREADVTWRDGYTGEPADSDMPVVHISWNDAMAYAEWLSSVTERNYRLPSEAEFEYGLRGGTQTFYWWGNGSPPRDEMTNLTGDGDLSESRRRWNDAFEDYTDGYWGPAPVASFETNPFGLYDMNGNVKEWTADCWHDSYSRAPTDGSAWINEGCDRRVVRGGDWASTPSESFSSARMAGSAQTRMPRLGFRVARDL